MSYWGDHRDDYKKGRQDEATGMRNYDYDKCSSRDRDIAYFQGHKDERYERDRREEERREEEHQEMMARQRHEEECRREYEEREQQEAEYQRVQEYQAGQEAGMQAEGELCGAG